MKVRIATRQSPLALWQANFVADRLKACHPGVVTIELVPIVTQGDRILDQPLAKIGGKGLFVKEIEQALLESRADLAVHSLKDVPRILAGGLTLAAICEREVAQDALVSNNPQVKTLDDLPAGAVLGTSSLRRACQVLHRYPDLKIAPLRGNVGTRLDKLDGGHYNAVVLAAAGLKRLDLAHRISSCIDYDTLLPAVGQGAVAVECRAQDAELKALLADLHHEPTALCVQAERAMNAVLGGSCSVPIAGFAHYSRDNSAEIILEGRVGLPSGHRLLKVLQSDHDPERLGQSVAEQLLAQGADEILRACEQ